MTDPNFPPLPEDLPRRPITDAIELVRTWTATANTRRTLFLLAGADYAREPERPERVAAWVKAAKDYRLATGQLSHYVEEWAQLRTVELAKSS